MLSVWLLTLTASAFQPSADSYIGQEPVRVRRYHTAQQHRLRHQAGWQAFQAGLGQGWQARFDERTGVAHRAWGPSIELGPIKDLAAAQAAVQGLFAQHPGLLGVDVDQLEPGRSGYVEHTDTWLLQFDQVVDGVPVWRSGVMARIKSGRLVLFGVDTVAIAAPAAPDITGTEATHIAVAGGPAGNASHRDLARTLMWLPVEQGAALVPRLAWEVRSKTDAPLGHWVSFVDAETGALLSVHNEIRFLSGQVLAEHDTRTVNGDMSISPMPFMRMDDGDDSVFTDEDGAWSIDSDFSVEGDLIGDYVRIHNEAGSEAVFEDLEGSVTLTDAEASQAELDAYIFQHQVREWAQRYAPDLSMIHTRIDVHVNIDDNCNAYFDGDLNFMRAGSGCNNTGRIADVNYHEWGHGFHYYNLVSGEFDGSISEGVSDAIATLLTGDSVISPYFYTSGHGIREVETDRVYPTDWVGEVHYDGLIFAGAVWDLWHVLETTMGEDAAYDHISSLVVEAMRAGPTIPDAFDEFVVADDDNGDLSDGTPHLCEIVDAFARHGLGPGGNGTLFSVSHLPLDNQLADTAISVDAEVVNMAPSCVDLDVASARVVYSIDGGQTWKDRDLALDGDMAAGRIPAHDSGTTIHYYVEVASSDGQLTTSPRGGEINPFTFFVGELEQIYCEDFESSDGGYTHQLLAGSGEEGADDWMWGTPIGLGGDPDYAHSGDKVWGNDLGGGQYNGEYQNDKHNRLNSPVIDVGDRTGLVLQYWRWLQVEDGYYDQANILVNGETAWTNHASSRSVGDEHHADEQWQLHSVPLAVDGSGEVSLSWEIMSDRGLSMGGWNIDDVCLYAVSTDTGSSETEEETGSEEANNSGGGARLGPVGLKSADGCACSVGQVQPTGVIWLAGLLGLAAARRRER